MSRKIKWGILGGAKIAVDQIIPAIRRSANGEVIALASRSERAKSIAESLQIPKAYVGYEKLLGDSEVEAVYIPLPNHLHREWVIKAARAGKHVLCEKPAALNADELREMLAACRENRVLFMEAFMYRFHPQHEKAKEFIRSGMIGEARMMRSSYSFLLKDPDVNIRTNPETGGGAVYDIGCYCLNVFRNILGKEPERVAAFAREKYGVDVTVTGRLHFPGDVLAIFDISFETARRQEYEIVGTDGRIRIPFAFRPDLNGGNGVIQIIKENEVREITVNADQYKLEVEHFADCVLKGTSPVISGEDSLSNMKAIDAVYQSMKTGKEVFIT